MAETHIALLRGINVGRAKRIAMADLRGVFESLGHTRVRTLLASGNVVFDPAGSTRGLGAKLEAAIERELGVSSRVTVVPGSELGPILEHNPLAHVAVDPSRYLVGFFADAASAARAQPLTTRDWSPDALVVEGNVVYLWFAEGVIESPLSKAFSRALGDGVTSRNWSTVQKLHALAQG